MTAGECLGGSFQTPLYHLHPCRRASLQASLSLERLCRYVSRPAVSEKRMALTPNGKIRYPLKTPWRDGTTHVLFEPLDFIARLAALAPEPRVNLTRFHGVFAPNSKHRIQVTPGKRGKGSRMPGSVFALMANRAFILPIHNSDNKKPLHF